MQFFMCRFVWPLPQSHIVPYHHRVPLVLSLWSRAYPIHLPHSNVSPVTTDLSSISIIFSFWGCYPRWNHSMQPFEIGLFSHSSSSPWNPAKLLLVLTVRSFLSPSTPWYGCTGLFNRSPSEGRWGCFSSLNFVLNLATSLESDHQYFSSLSYSLPGWVLSVLNPESLSS